MRAGCTVLVYSPLAGRNRKMKTRAAAPAEGGRDAFPFTRECPPRTLPLGCAPQESRICVRPRALDGLRDRVPLPGAPEERESGAASIGRPSAHSRFNHSSALRQPGIQDARLPKRPTLQCAAALCRQTWVPESRLTSPSRRNHGHFRPVRLTPCRAPKSRNGGRPMGSGRRETGPLGAIARTAIPRLYCRLTSKNPGILRFF
jgi:hypothetical protein